MGSTFKLSSMNKDKIEKLMTPLIFCMGQDKLASYSEEYNVLSINGLLAKKLLEYEPDKRGLFIADEFNNIIDSIDEPVLLKDFEILFDPDFQIDVLKLFIMTNRKKRIAVLWCGKYRSGKLIFAEPEYEDYKAYNINDYDISCIIL